MPQNSQKLSWSTKMVQLLLQNLTYFAKLLASNRATQDNSNETIKHSRNFNSKRRKKIF